LPGVGGMKAVPYAKKLETEHEGSPLRKRTVLLGIFILILALISGGAYYWTQVLTKSVPTERCLKVGATIGLGDFTLPIVDRNGLTNQKLTLSDLQCKVIVIEFNGPWCDYCWKQEPTMRSLYATYSAKGVVFLAIVSSWKGTSPSDVAKYIKDYESNSTFLYDSTGHVSDLYNVTVVPWAFILAKNGTVAASFRGSTTYEAFSAILDSLNK